MISSRRSAGLRRVACLWVFLAVGCETAPCPSGLVLDDAQRCVAPGDDAGPVDAASDGEVLLPDGCRLRVYYADADGDGHGDPDSMTTSCEPVDGYVAEANDCDDDCDRCWDDAVEACDTFDNDCDGTSDEGVATTYYVDSDGDGHGAAASTMRACTMPTGYVTTGDDCDDASMASAPGGTETCDGADNDCTDGPDDTFECVQSSSVACTTACGTTGSSACSAACMLSTVCVAPPETCDAVDQDCDDVIDEGTLGIGLALEHATTARNVVSLETADGFLVLFSTTAVFAQRIDANGALVGAAEMVAPTTAAFGAAIQGDHLVITWIQGTDIRAVVLDASTFGPVTAPTVVGGAGDFATGVRVVTTSTSATFVYYSGSGLYAFSRTFPALGAGGAQFTVAAGTRADFDVTSLGGRCYVAYASTTDQVSVFNFPIGASSTTGSMRTTVTAAGVVARMPAIYATETGDGPDRLGVAYAFVGTSITSEVRLVIYQPSPTGALSTIDSPAALTLNPLPSIALPSGAIDVTWGGGRFVVAALDAASSGTASRFVYSTVTEPPSGVPMVVGSTVVSGDLQHTSVAVTRGVGGTILFTHSLSGGTARSYFLGCPE